MIPWRVSNYQNLDGVGGLYVSDRWHTKGHPAVYCTFNPAIASLETLVYMEIDSEDRPASFQVLKVEGPDTLSVERIAAGALGPGWTEEIASTQNIGDRWFSEGRSLLLQQVPSVLVPETWNVLVNPSAQRGEAPEDHWSLSASLQYTLALISAAGSRFDPSKAFFLMV